MATDNNKQTDKQKDNHHRLKLPFYFVVRALTKPTKRVLIWFM